MNKSVIELAKEAGFDDLLIKYGEVFLTKFAALVRAEYEKPLKLAGLVEASVEECMGDDGMVAVIPLDLYNDLMDAIREALADHSGDANEMVAPEGYALISIDALKAWDKYDDVRNACLFSAEPVKQEPEFVGWYCAHCERGVDASEVTFHEQHEVCGRVITNDVPPKPVKQEPVANKVLRLLEPFMPVDTKAIRAEALEEAAKVCSDKIRHGQVSEYQHRYNFAYDDCAAAIRNLSLQAKPLGD